MVDLTADTEKDMDEAPASTSPNVSDGSNMDTDEEEDLLAYQGIDRNNDSSSDQDGFQHV